MTAADLMAALTTCTPHERAQSLIAHGFYQISRVYRTLARLPEGATGKEALNSTARSTARPTKLEEGRAGDQYLRVYAPQHDRVEIDHATFRAYRALGGGDYHDVTKRGGFKPR